MLAECLERMRQGVCETCERRDACAFPWLHGEIEPPRFRRFGRQAAHPQASRSPFLAFLGEVAKAFEGWAEPKDVGVRHHARRTAEPKPTALQRDVEALVEPLLETGEARIDRIARELGLSRQTLYRRLKAEGVTFEQVVERVRRRLALRYVREQGLSVKEAAWRLGFSDPAAFSRAFKRWTGSSPRATPR